MQALNHFIMRNYNREIEAAYLTSIRQGNMMRDREQEQSTHQNRSNRYLSNNQPNPSQRYDLNIDQRTGYGNSYRSAQDSYRQYFETNNRGKGPRNYRRSDERIKELVCDALVEDPFLDASEIHVEVSDGHVTLQGSVQDRRAKWLAEDIVERAVGVSDIENRLRVQR
jgi:osmotically-inducible protein OsmY